MNYTQEEINLIRMYGDLPKKKCKECLNVLPVHEVFFLKEKRIKDGYENKCRKCRRGSFLIGQDSKGRVKIDKSIPKKFKTIEDQYEHFMNTNTLSCLSFVLDHHLYIFKYIIDKENIKITELNKLDRDWFKEKRLYSPLLKIYKGIVYSFVNAAYPNTFKPWDFITVGRQYWQNKENRLFALNWLVNKALEDKVINRIEDIPCSINGEYFRDNSLGGLLDNHYKSIVFFAFNELYPDKFYIWQYNNLPGGFYEVKENRINSMKELVEKYLKLNIKDIPKVFSYEYFNLSYTDKYLIKFKHMLDRHYNSVYEFINEVYPNTFKESEFPYKNHYITLDNIKVRSEPERMIHHLFMSMKINYRYGDCVGKININNVNVLPDWYIFSNGKIVLVEYYGMLNMHHLDFGYDDKYKMKTELYNDLCSKDNNYIYLPLYKGDLKHDFKGIKDKLIEYNII